MKTSEKKTAFATLDIGTSQIKLGVYCPSLSDKIILVSNVQNEIVYGRSGDVRADYSFIREKVFLVFDQLGSFLKDHSIEVLYLGICGHISSLLEWNRVDGTPPAEPFPTWLDTTCYDSLDEYRSILGDGKSKSIIGTFLPAGTNWLFTKLLHRRKSGFDENSVFLQVSDGIFYELTGHFKTHFSSQLSMVDLKTRTYAKALLDHLQLNESYFPDIQYEPLPVTDQRKNQFDLPSEAYVFPAMADLYTSLYGLRLKDKQGFMLANTSEQAGVFFNNTPRALDNFLSISFNRGFINYGSTNTGGNVVNWFLTNVLKKEPSAMILDELTNKARNIHPNDTPIILPYLQGERAPLWNSRLTASIIELKSAHTEVHLFRAILESISFARRQCFDQLGRNELDLVKLGGGSSKNHLWNSIRAGVLNKPVAVSDEKELSMAGIIDYIMETRESPYSTPPINFSLIEPEPELVDVYEEKYARFIKYQELLS